MHLRSASPRRPALRACSRQKKAGGALTTRADASSACFPRIELQSSRSVAGMPAHDAALAAAQHTAADAAYRPRRAIADVFPTPGKITQNL